MQIHAGVEAKYLELFFPPPSSLARFDNDTGNSTGLSVLSKERAD